jgi:hypothetical protein
VDIPATSSNIPGTLVLRDALGTAVLESARLSSSAPTSGVDAEFIVQNTNTSADTHTKIVFRSRDTTNTGRHGSSISMLKDGNWVGGSGSYPGHLTFWTRQAAAEQFERLRITSAGNVGIGTTSPDADAILDVSSTTRGFLPPRMTTTQRDAIAAPVPAGLMVYNSTTNKLNFYNGTAWEAVTSA